MSQSPPHPDSPAAPTATATPARSWKKWLGVAAVFILAGCSIYWGIRTAFPPPPSMPGDLDGITALLQSKSFQKMSDRQRQPYYEKMRELTRGIDPKKLGEKFRNLPKEVRDDPTFRANSRDAMADQMMTMISLWAATPAPLRNMLLDKMIDQQQAALANRKPRSPGSSEEEAERKARRDRERDEGMKWVQQQVERGNPQKQAYVSEFLKAMRERRVARGLPADPPAR